MKCTGNDIKKQYEIIPIGQAKDIRGKEFKRLRVIERVKDSRKGVFWLCKCKCGNYKVARGGSLTSGDTTSCGCRLAEKLAPHDITGQKFGRLTAVEITNKRSKSGDAYWKCLCDCGNYTTVPKSRVSSGNVQSCGCLVGELASERLKAWTPEERRDRAKKDITGQRFGRLIAIKPTKQKDGTNIVWEMKCDCGDTTYVSTANLGDDKRKTKSCGCLHRDVIFKDLKGQRFGRLVATEEDGHIGNRIAWECLCDCGNTTRVDGGHLKSGGTRSCGCIVEEMVGKNHPNYNPNKTDEERLLKRYVLGKHTMDGFRKAVYKRDEYTCQLCGQVGGSLNAHHLDGWNWAKDKRFDVDNGVTLCEGCHMSFHNKYGKGHNTKEQFKEFKQSAKLEEYTEASV